MLLKMDRKQADLSYPSPAEEQLIKEHKCSTESDYNDSLLKPVKYA